MLQSDGGAVDLPEKRAKVLQSATVVLTVTFVGAPALIQPDIDKGATDPADKDAINDPSSALAAFTDAEPSGTGALWEQVRAETETTEVIPSASDEEVHIVAEIRDEEGNLIHGSGQDSSVSFQVTYDSGSELRSGRQYTYSIVEDVASGRASIQLNGWSVVTDDGPLVGPVKVTVTASYTGPTAAGAFPLGTVKLSRFGPLAEVQASICFADDDDEEDSDLCGEKSRSRTVFAPGGVFRIANKAVDVLGTKTDEDTAVKPSEAITDKGERVIKGATPSELDDAFDRPADTTTDATDWYIIHAKAPAGAYDIEVKASEGTGDDKVEKVATLTLIVGGDPEMYDVSGPESIALTSFASAEYTIKVIDEAGNTPAFDDDEDMVLVVVESALNVRVTGLNDDGEVMLDPETGETMFTVFKPAGAERGDTASIGIFVSDELMDQLMVTFGEPFMAPGMPMNVMAEATSYSEDHCVLGVPR